MRTCLSNGFRLRNDPYCIKLYSLTHPEQWVFYDSMNIDSDPYTPFTHVVAYWPTVNNGRKSSMACRPNYMGFIMPAGRTASNRRRRGYHIIVIYLLK